MKQVDLSNIPDSDSPFAKLRSQLQQVLGGGDRKALDTLARLFSSGLNNHFVLVRNLVIPGEDRKAPPSMIPCVLVGPSCLLVIHPSDLRGFYSAREESWLELDKSTQDYRPAPRNLIQETLSMTDRLNAAMQAGGLPYPEIQPVLFFANTSIHVESVRPLVRILQLDTVERYLSSLRMNEPLLDARQVQALVDYLSGLEQANQALQSEMEAQARKMNRSGSDQAVTAVNSMVSDLRLNRKQWLTLGAMLTGTILILILLIVVILFLA